MNNTHRLLVPDVMGRAGIDMLRAREDVDLLVYDAGIATAEFREIIADADGIALWATPFRQPDLDAAPRLAAVARLGVGYDAVEVPALTARAVPLMVTGTANSVSVAEHALFLLLAVAKRARAQDAVVRSGDWSSRYDDMPVEIAGRTVLVVGFGRIGTRMARRCLAMDMTVLVHDPYVEADVIRQAGCEPAPELDSVLAQTDFVTIHCPRTEQTLGMFDAPRLARLKRGAALVNTARGGIVDERALLAALENGQLSGAGLDVWAEEPTPPDHPLLRLAQVIAAPHIAGSTGESTEGMARETARNLLSVIDGAPIAANVVNKEVLR
ncbi:MAG: hydroxyacid dehydrogenase [Acidisphaera sp.]|nr:hydroxyacid dehydrogenase [Acidisphaera sp.]